MDKNNNLLLLKLHTNKQYLDQCCDLLNDFWPRSKTARLHSLNKSNDNYPCNYILVNTDDDQIIGHVTVSLDNRFNNDQFKVAYIESLIIHRDYRRQGLGKFIMLELEKRLIQEQFKMITLKTIDQVKFYESIGFTMKSKTKSLVIGHRRQIQNEIQSNFGQAKEDKKLNEELNKKSGYKLNDKSDEINNKTYSFDLSLPSVNLPPPPPLPSQSKINQPSQLYEYHMEKLIS